MDESITDFPDSPTPKKKIKLLSLFFMSFVFAFAKGTKSDFVSFLESKEIGLRVSSLSNDHGFKFSLLLSIDLIFRN
jgi:hypothetical protein